uniref:equilibrative nucleobase transporter 1-like n=1 Tax=Pristiophorus japonicus TaxID=55135 RepID=UPI00398E56B9
MWNEKFKRYLTLATGLFECLGFAGVIFGWASLVFVLKKDRFFADLCRPLHNSTDRAFKNDTMDCGKQDDRFSLVFTIASFMNNFSTIPSGFLFDHFGTAITRFLGILTAAYRLIIIIVTMDSPSESRKACSRSK